MNKKCRYCGSETGCEGDKGFPCTPERAAQVERNYGYGTPGDTRSFWD